jgi:hypothetical protein
MHTDLGWGTIGREVHGKCGICSADEGNIGNVSALLPGAGARETDKCGESSS